MYMPALADSSDGYELSDLGEKTADALVIPGQYEITVGVPGAVSTEKYSEIIVMVDASSSQGANLASLKTMLVDLAEEVLHNDGSVRLMLMGFGFGPALVGSFYNAETLEAYLVDVTQSDLRQGTSATNCEATLKFVSNYINNSDKLDQTYVVFTSDGNANMDETPFSLSTWDEHPEWYYKNNPVSFIAEYAVSGQKYQYLSGGHSLEATTTLYPEDAVAIELAISQYGADSETVSALIDTMAPKILASEATQIAYVDASFRAAFENAGYVYSDAVGYTTSQLEKVFLDYADGAVYNTFLCSIHRMVNAGMHPDWYNLSTWGARAAAAANELADNAKVHELYMVDFKIDDDWMNPTGTNAHRVTSDNITYMTADGFSAAIDRIETLGDEMFTTLYKDTTVVDPMSKWVTMDPSSIRIYEDDLLIYEYGKGWLYEDKQPAADPITLSTNAEGRTVITWRIKDGALLYTDRYFLKYVVNVDETVEGFEYGKEYPANDPTYVEYTDENGENQSVPVEVPNVKQPTDPDDIAEGEYGLRIYKGSQIDDKPSKASASRYIMS